MPKLLVREKSASLGIFLVLLILLLSVVLSLQTAANPEIGFLPPSFSSGHWMLAPIELSRVDEGLAAMFRKDFVVPDGAGGISSALVMVTAARSYELRLNGQVRSGPSERGLGRNWKVPQEFDLTDGLARSEEHTSELQSPCNLVCRLLLEKKKNHTDGDT